MGQVSSRLSGIGGNCSGTGTGQYALLKASLVVVVVVVVESVDLKGRTEDTGQNHTHSREYSSPLRSNELYYNGQ